MTDRLKGCVVTFESDVREDDARLVLDAIRQLRGVVHVSTVLAGPSDHITRMRARCEMREKLWKAFGED